MLNRRMDCRVKPGNDEVNKQICSYPRKRESRVGSLLSQGRAAIKSDNEAGFAGAEVRARGCGLFAYFTVMTRPLRSALTMAPTELPVSCSTAPLGLVSTIACTPRPTAAPTFPAA